MSLGILFCIFCNSPTLDELPEIKRLFNGNRIINFAHYGNDDSAYTKFLNKIHTSYRTELPSKFKDLADFRASWKFPNYTFLKQTGNPLKAGFCLFELTRSRPYTPTTTSFVQQRYVNSFYLQPSLQDEIITTSRAWFDVEPVANTPATYWGK